MTPLYLFKVRIEYKEDYGNVDLNVIALDDAEARTAATELDAELWKQAIEDDVSLQKSGTHVPTIAYCNVNMVCKVDVVGAKVRWPSPRPVESKTVSTIVLPKAA